jgi:phage gp36-like protein
MATKTIILTPSGITVPDASSSGYATFPMPNDSLTRCIIPLTAGVPFDFYAISSVSLIIRSASTGNLYLRAGTTRFDISAEGAVEAVTGSYVAYAGGLGTGVTEFITLPAASYALTDLNISDFLNFVIDRDATSATDTYEADLDIVGIKFVYTTGWAAGVHYASQTDMEYRIGTLALAEYANDTVGATTPNANVIEQILTDVDALIDSKCGILYTVPFTTVPDLITDIATDLACYKAMTRKPTNVAVGKDWIQINKDCIQQLDDIGAGKVNLPTTATLATDSGVVEALESAKLVDFNDEDNGMYEF